MHGFKEMDQDLARRLIEAEEDVLTPAAKLEGELFARLMCPLCGGEGASKVVRPPTISLGRDGPEVRESCFSEGRLLAVGDAECLNCQALFAPETSVIVRAPPNVRSVEGLSSADTE